MKLVEAVARWSTCDKDRCLGGKKCVNYIFVDPRRRGKKGVGPGKTGQRTLCSLLGDLDKQVMRKTEITG